MILNIPYNIRVEDLGSLLPTDRGQIFEITEIHVCVGPGKYTALRIGIAFALGLGKALGVRVRGYSIDKNGAVVSRGLEPRPIYAGEPNAVPNVPPPIVNLPTNLPFPDRVNDTQLPQESISISQQIDFVERLENAVFLRDAWPRPAIEKAFSDGTTTFFFIHEDDDINKDIVGAAYIMNPATIPPNQDPSQFEVFIDLLSIGIMPEFQGRGYGHKLLKRVLDVAQNVYHADAVFLEVRESNLAAQKIYSDLGFIHTRTRKNYYSSREDSDFREDALEMKLTFEHAEFPVVGNSRFNVDRRQFPSFAAVAPEQCVGDGVVNPYPPLTLGIESSCDETGVALIRDGKILSSALASSLDQHKVFGGVIPEIASRAHLEALPALIDELFPGEGGIATSHDTSLTASPSSKLTLQNIDQIAVTAGPGLIGCLVTGVAYAKGLTLGLDKPLYGVNHVLGHIYAASLEHDLPERFLGLIVSGGHTSLVIVEGLGFREIGGTLDDAVGEAFDKVGRLLGLDYPAGPQIDKLAKKGNPATVQFPRPLIAPKFMLKHKYDFSFSGLKTAAVRELEKQAQDPATSLTIEDFCASFAEASVDVLYKKTLMAMEEFNIDTVVVGGGFSANSQLRDKFANLKTHAKHAIFAKPSLCTDNGDMIANLGAKLAAANFLPSDISFRPVSVMSLNEPLI